MPTLGELWLAKLGETLAREGAMGLIKTWQMRRTGRAAVALRREEILMLANADREVELLKRKFTEDDELSSSVIVAERDARPLGGNKLMPFIDMESLAGIAANDYLRDYVRRESNVSKAVIQAEVELEEETQAPDEAVVDSDWLFKWRESAGQSSAETMQALWGRILAGELKTPGTFSLRAMDFVKNLSGADAAMIDRVAPLMSGKVIYRIEGYLEGMGLTTEGLLDLEELGVIAGVGSLGLNQAVQTKSTDSFLGYINDYSRVLIITRETVQPKLEIPVYHVTGLGRQIMSLSKLKPEIGYMEAVGAFIKQKGFIVHMADVFMKDGQTQYDSNLTRLL